MLLCWDGERHNAAVHGSVQSMNSEKSQVCFFCCESWLPQWVLLHVVQSLSYVAKILRTVLCCGASEAVVNFYSRWEENSTQKLSGICNGGVELDGEDSI